MTTRRFQAARNSSWELRPASEIGYLADLLEIGLEAEALDFWQAMNRRRRMTWSPSSHADSRTTIQAPSSVAHKCYTSSSQENRMGTTTIRLEEELKARVVTAAERAGKTAHAFILDAIAQRVEQVEQDDDFHRQADERWAAVLSTGKTVPWDEAKAHLEARARGEKPRRPVARKLGR